MKIELKSKIFPDVMPSMHVYAELEKCIVIDETIRLTHPCASYSIFAGAIDQIIQNLESVKSQARTKFDEFEKR